MRPTSRVIQPPRLATWLIRLFTLDRQQSEALQGDLLEEFSEIVSASGAARARRWYWRQSIKTIAHLSVVGFRSAALVISGSLIVGYFLLSDGPMLLERAATAFIVSRPVIPKIDPFTFTFLIGLFGHVITPILVGCAIAMAVKGRELIVTMILGLVESSLYALILALLARYDQPRFLFVWRYMLITIVVTPFLLMLGGAIVRIRRSTPRHLRAS